MVTIDAAEGAGMPELYSEEQREMLQNEIFGQVIGLQEEENSLLDAIFGVQAKVMYEVFKEKTIKDAKWIFNATKLRQRVHEAANMPLTHIQ